MITLITGVPGSGKSLHAVSDLLLPLQNVEIEHDGNKIKRVLHTNIKNLLLDHVLIDKDDLLRWHEWCKPGNLICFDEVQEVWRPRSMGALTPESIGKLETHRHMGVDFILVTQHPMLLDQNIRRLVGRHLHVRRVANMALAIVYEWDHASNPAMVKSAIATRPWRYPKSAYKLYKSADVHTKQTKRLPFAIVVMLFAFVGLGLGIWSLQGGLLTRYDKPVVVKNLTDKPISNVVQPGATIQPTMPTSMSIVTMPPSPERPLGCIANSTRCVCYDQLGLQVPISDDQCRKASTELIYIVRDKQSSAIEYATTANTSPPDRQSSGSASMSSVPNVPHDNVNTPKSLHQFSKI